MASVQDKDKEAAFMIVSDFNAHHQDWLKSRSITDAHGRAALDFASLSGCFQLMEGATHQYSNCLDLVFTDVPDVVNVAE